ncbi:MULTISPECIES: CDP-glycerol glycerophosphotransferase family protein [unclassified Streptomyces]|uniref:bifunctional glycosyltransferase/CDP-glycerol:glycerophosphate glycerophosphotransferase n=1 Tax=unclassified Streptomyces TaxID=2593676 RepID=UPI0035DF559B
MLLSVVVPAHRVQGYLRAALESVTGQARDEDGPEIELIAVAAPGGGPDLAIAREAAGRDPRVRVLVPDRPRDTEPSGTGTGARCSDGPRDADGLRDTGSRDTGSRGTASWDAGAARDAGAAAARGAYLLFLDGNDLLLPGAVAEIAARLARDRPDVLRLGHDTVDWWGAVRPGGELPAARNQLFRRAFWEAHGLRFTEGPYGDVLPVHRAALLASDAGTLASLDRICVRHRLRRTGTSATTPGRAHFAVVAAYERLAAETGGDPRITAARTAHLTAVLDDPGRIAPQDRAAFHRAAGLPGRYAAHRAREAVRAGRTRARAAARAGRKSLRARVMAALYRVDLRRPLDPRLAVYGAYWNRGVACNPAAVYAKARELVPHIRGVWVVSSRHRDRMPPGVPYVVEGSRAYWRTMATATYLVNNSSFPGGFTKRPGQTYLQTHHGTPLKTMGLDQLPYPALTNGVSFERIVAHTDQWDFSLSANPHSTETWDRVYPSSYEQLPYGYPRNDVLCTATPELSGRIRADLGIAPGSTVLLYAPTHRDYRKGFVPRLDPERLTRELGPGWVLLVRAHYFYGRSAGTAPGAQVLDVTGHPSVEELCLAADALITDYSSLMFDYACLDRPVITYAPDWDAYRAARGTYIDLLSGRPGDTPGAVATTEDELREVLRGGAWRSPEADALRAAFRSRFCPYDDGRAAERVVRRVFPVPPG